MAALANSGVPTVNPALNVKQQLALAILGGQGTATQMLRERRKNLTTASQPKGMSAGTTDMEVLIKLVCVIVESYSVCLYIFDCICLPIMVMGVLPETHTQCHPQSKLVSGKRLYCTSSYIITSSPDTFNDED